MIILVRMIILPFSLGAYLEVLISRVVRVRGRRV